MRTLEASGPNAEQINYWNSISAPKWIPFQAAFDDQLAPLGEAAIAAAAIRSGERVLDVGCGCGQTTIELAGRVGGGGFVVGIDISAPMLDRAREIAQDARIANVDFENADAQTYAFSPSEFDLVYSRFGIMFFSDPVAAFGNLRRALRGGGRVSFVCWQALERNPWMAIPLAAAAREIALPPPPAPGAPGPFSFGSEERVRAILLQAGFVDVVVEPLESTLAVGGAGATLAEAAEFLVQMGPTGAALREADPSALSRVTRAVKEAIASFHGARGLRMAAAAWIVTAHNP
jgi:SAM-dependent methyltransferase